VAGPYGAGALGGDEDGFAGGGLAELVDWEIPIRFGH
jgi:hypothetical protein